ncbi:MAG: AbrB/MazE/SpoVT family DNA-binding domain-containing protein [Patescibacteria group bacterium]|jgi:antitoxin MazE
MNTKVQQWGGSQGVRIPKNILETIGLHINDLVEIVAGKDSLIIRKPKKYDIKTLFAHYKGEYQPEDVWGSSVGQEAL